VAARRGQNPVMFPNSFSPVLCVLLWFLLWSSDFICSRYFDDVDLVLDYGFIFDDHRHIILL
jgi:hypothetical protein